MTFDVFSLAAGTTHPKDSVKINLDDDLAYQARKIEEKLNASHRAGLSQAEVKRLEKQLKGYQKQLKDNLVTIKLQGITSEERSKILEQVDDLFGKDTESAARNKKHDSLMFLAHYQGATDAQGVEDESKWDEDKAEQFLQMIPEEAYGRIVNKIIDLSIRSDNYEIVETSADFS